MQEEKMKVYTKFLWPKKFIFVSLIFLFVYEQQNNEFQMFYLSKYNFCIIKYKFNV